MPEISNRAREALYPSVREMFELASHVPDAISFAIGEPGFDTPRPMIDAAYRAALAGDTHYTPNRGAEALRRAWCDARERADGTRYDPESEIIITAGGDHHRMSTGAVVLLTSMIRQISSGLSLHPRRIHSQMIEETAETRISIA